MTKEYEGRAFVATHSTLKWFIIVGTIILSLGLLIYLFFSPFIGSIALFLGFSVIALSGISLLFLWLTERMLPQPK